MKTHITVIKWVVLALLLCELPTVVSKAVSGVIFIPIDPVAISCIAILALLRYASRWTSVIATGCFFGVTIAILACLWVPARHTGLTWTSFIVLSLLLAGFITSIHGVLSHRGAKGEEQPD